MNAETAAGKSLAVSQEPHCLPIIAQSDTLKVRTAGVEGTYLHGGKGS